MKQFKTYGEWREITMYGENLSDALERTATLKRPDFFDVPSYGKAVEVELEVYNCEHCGHDSKVLGKALEPFYCTCGSLISIA